MQTPLIEQLASWRGIQADYVDAWGNPATVKPENKKKLLAAMGYPTHDDESLVERMSIELMHQWTRMLPPVLVFKRVEYYELTISVLRDQANQLFKWTLTQEDGQCRYGQFTPLDGELLETKKLDGNVYQRYRLKLHISLDFGYHQLQLSDVLGKPFVRSRFIVTPHSCYKPGLLDLGRKVWGPSVQLYCLRSERNWGVGDFTDLKYLVAEIAKHGGDFVGLNPIHALYPANPNSCSPYSPSSRRWLNIIYIDVEAVPELAKCDAAQQVIADKAFQQQLAALREVEWVDYEAVTEQKLHVLRLLFEHFQTKVANGRSKRAKAFEDFVVAGGESLREQAAFDALALWFKNQDKPCWGWPAWPEEYRSYHSPVVQEFIQDHADDVGFFLYLQWLADEQLQQISELALNKGMLVGLYRDLAVGVSEGSTEVWANAEIYRVDASVGAPPDILGPLGQNWGLPPMDPQAVVEQGYQPFIDLFRANMRHCGALRIDHVMALLRLWWVPKGEDAKEGAYISYPIQDLLNILALESHRNQAMVIGEDLGTVPDGIFETLQEAGVHSYRVFFFERSKTDGGFIAPEHYPVQAMATIGTHDMPTLRGYWNADDLTLGKELGLYRDPDVLAGLYADRQDAKQRILDSMHSKGSLPASISSEQQNVAMDRELNYAMQKHLAHASSSLLALQMEDWLEMDKPVNIPGTSDEYPNWRRKLSALLSDMFERAEVIHLLDTLTDIRHRVSTDQY